MTDYGRTWTIDSHDPQLEKVCEAARRIRDSVNRTLQRDWEEMVAKGVQLYPQMLPRGHMEEAALFVEQGWELEPKCECGSGSNAMGPGHSDYCACYLKGDV